MTKTDCVYCKIFQNKATNDKEQFIWEGKYFYSIYEPYPVSPGHAVLIAKNHTNSLTDFNKSEWSEILTAIKYLINSIESANLETVYQKFLHNPLNDAVQKYSQLMLHRLSRDKKPDGYNIGTNEGKAAGRTIDHVHVHIIPRYLGDIDDPTGGVRNVISKLGNWKDPQI